MEAYRIHEDVSLYFVTSRVVFWLPVFVAETPCRIITESLQFCHERKGLRVNAYVIMPTHMHAILFHESFDAKPLDAAILAFRKYTGHQLCTYCEQHLPPCFNAEFRAQAGADRERRFWQSSRHAEQIETEAFWKTKLGYIHDNPCRKGLVLYPEHRRFSSAAHWAGEAPVKSGVTLSELAC